MCSYWFCSLLGFEYSFSLLPETLAPQQILVLTDRDLLTVGESAVCLNLKLIDQLSLTVNEINISNDHCNFRTQMQSESTVAPTAWHILIDGLVKCAAGYSLCHCFWIVCHHYVHYFGLLVYAFHILLQDCITPNQIDAADLMLKDYLSLLPELYGEK